MAANDPDYRAFIARLIRARREAGLKQADVADQLGKPQSYVSKCEAGDRRVDVIELVRLARIYGKSLDWFVAEDEGTTVSTEESNPGAGEDKR